MEQTLSTSSSNNPNPIDSEIIFIKQLNDKILSKTFPFPTTTAILDYRYFYLYSDLIEAKITQSSTQNLQTSKPKFKQNKLGDNFLFLKRISLDSMELVERFLIFLDLYLLKQYREECKSYSIIAYRLGLSERGIKVLDLLYQDEMDAIVIYPILQDYFLYYKRSQGLSDTEKEGLFDLVAEFMLGLGGNYIEKIDCFYAKMDFIYHIEAGKKRHAIKFSKEEDLNEYYLMNKLRIQYEQMTKAVKNDLEIPPGQRIWVLVSIAKRFFQLKFNKEALVLIEETLELRKKLWGENHFETFDSWNRMAAILFREKEFDCAYEIFHNVLLKRKEVYLEDSKPVLITLYNMATVCEKKGGYIVALEHFAGIEHILKKKQCSDEKNLLNDVLLGKATCYNMLNRVEEAILTYEEILGRIEGRSILEELKKSLNLNNLAVCFKKQRNFVKYYCYKLKAFLIFTQIKGEEKAKKKELEEIFKKMKIQMFFYEVYTVKKKLQSIFKRRLILEDIVKNFI